MLVLPFGNHLYQENKNLQKTMEDLNLETIFKSYYIFIPFIAILIGFLPGCGPQILVTTL